MRQRSRANTSSLFLLEFILAILFFSVASAFCVQIFVKSHLISKDAQDLNFAVTEVSNAVEQISPDSDVPSDVIVYYDEAYKQCEKDRAAYQLSTHFQKNGMLLSIDITMKTIPDEHTIYTLNTVKHQQRRVGA